DWWHASYNKAERHHVWPKWLLGDEKQVGMMLPRCVHNMAGDVLHEGGFHQVLDRLFAEDEEFAKEGLRSDKPDRVRKFIREHRDRRGVRQRIRELLEAANRKVLKEPGVLAAVDR